MLKSCVLKSCKRKQFNNLFFVLSFPEILCPAFSTPANGEISGSRRNVGAVVRFDCMPGYSLRGSRSAVCGATGQWDNKSPVCVCKYLCYFRIIRLYSYS